MGDNRQFALFSKTTTHCKSLNALAPTTRWLFVVLAVERRGRDTWFEASYKKLHETTGFSTATIRKAIVGLRDAGFVEVDGGGLECNPNLYYIDPKWLGA